MAAVSKVLQCPPIPYLLNEAKIPFTSTEFRLGLLYLFLPLWPCAQDDHVAARRSKYELEHWWLTFIISLPQEKGKYIAGMEFSLGFCEQAILCPMRPSLAPERTLFQCQQSSCCFISVFSSVSSVDVRPLVCSWRSWKCFLGEPF